MSTGLDQNAEPWKPSAPSAEPSTDAPTSGAPKGASAYQTFPTAPNLPPSGYPGFYPAAPPGFSYAPVPFGHPHFMPPDQQHNHHHHHQHHQLHHHHHHHQRMTGHTHPQAPPQAPSAVSNNNTGGPNPPGPIVDKLELIEDVKAVFGNSSYIARKIDQYSGARAIKMVSINSVKDKEIKAEFRAACNQDPNGWRERTLWITSYDFHVMKEPELMCLLPMITGVKPFAANMRPNTHDAYVVFNTKEDARKTEELMRRRVQIVRHADVIYALDYGEPGRAPQVVTHLDIGIPEGEPLKMPRRPLHVEPVSIASQDKNSVGGPNPQNSKQQQQPTPNAFSNTPSPSVTMPNITIRPGTVAPNTAFPPPVPGRPAPSNTYPYVNNMSATSNNDSTPSSGIVQNPRPALHVDMNAGIFMGGGGFSNNPNSNNTTMLTMMNNRAADASSSSSDDDDSDKDNNASRCDDEENDNEIEEWILLPIPQLFCRVCDTLCPGLLTSKGFVPKGERKRSGERKKPCLPVADDFLKKLQATAGSSTTTRSTTMPPKVSSSADVSSSKWGPSNAKTEEEIKNDSDRFDSLLSKRGSGGAAAPPDNDFDWNFTGGGQGFRGAGGLLADFNNESGGTQAAVMDMTDPHRGADNSGSLARRLAQLVDEEEN